MKINHCLFILLLSGFTYPSVAQWTQLNSGVNDLSLSSIKFVNDSTGFATGCDATGCDYPSVWSGGYILKTIDAGNTWNPLQNPQAYARTSISFASTNIGYISGTDILKTIDGTTWFHPCSTTGFNSRFIYFINDSVGFINGYPGFSGHTIRKTIDGGVNWNSSSSFNPLSQITSVFFTSPQVGFAIGHDSSLVLKTTDGGDNWNPVSTLYSLLSVHFPSQNNGYAVGYNGTIIHTTDSGDNWSPQISGTNVNLRSIYCLNDNVCYAVGDSGTILKTTDGGNLWIMQNSGTTQELRSVYCTSNHCYAAGDSGVIFKTVDGEVGIIENNIEKKSNFHFYPNPVLDNLTIQSASSSEMKYLTIYDMLGKEILKENFVAQKYSFNLTGLIRGIYIIEMRNEKSIVREKLIKE